MLINGTDLRAVTRGINPLTNITPFTYRDGLTFERLLYMIKDYMLETMGPHFESEISRIIEEFNSELTRIETQYGKDHADLTETVNDFIERTEDYVRTWVDPVAKAAVKKYLDDYVNDPNTLSLFNGVFASKATEDAVRKQSHLYGEFYRKLRSGLAVKICALGDSTTYGYDVVSSDRVMAPTGNLPDGSHHTHDRVPRPYPSVLESRLNEVYGSGTVEVINRGFSGDTTATAFPRWNTPHGAGLTLISFGINDVNSLSVVQFVEAYEKLILREINDYSSAVVILTAFKANTANPNRKIDVYRSSIVAMAGKYGVPVVDAEPWLSAYGTEYFSDTIHMSSKGYEVIGTRAASLFIGAGPMEKMNVSHGSRISVRPTIDNCHYGDGSAIYNLGTVPANNSPAEGGSGSIYASLTNSAMYYSFYADIGDVEVSASYAAFDGATFKIEVDFGITQPDNLLDDWVNEAGSMTARTPAIVEIPASVGVTYGSSQQVRYSNTLRISSPGWHTVKVSSVTTKTQGVRFMGLEFLSQRTFNPPIVRNQLTLASGMTGNYSQTYYRTGGEVALEGGVTKSGGWTVGAWHPVTTLPPGYRPAIFHIFTAPINNGGTMGADNINAQVRIGTSGDIEIGVGRAFTGAIMLNNVRFIPKENG